MYIVCSKLLSKAALHVYVVLSHLENPADVLYRKHCCVISLATDIP